jgi:hypothetical protein
MAIVAGDNPAAVLVHDKSAIRADLSNMGDWAAQVRMGE